MMPGMDIGGVLDLEGNPVMPLLLQAADGAGNGFIELTQAWPHPSTHEIDPMSAWCGRLTEMDVVCALTWNQEGGAD
jgi:hypothetical protein